MNNKAMEFQTIATLLIIIVVLIGIVTFFASQMGLLTGGFGEISSSAASEGSETGETISGLRDMVTGTGCTPGEECTSAGGLTYVCRSDRTCTTTLGNACSIDNDCTGTLVCTEGICSEA